MTGCRTVNNSLTLKNTKYKPHKILAAFVFP
nr:MAG TPA: hypothetical protein [Caudoviricetes sp.]